MTRRKVQILLFLIAITALTIRIIFASYDNFLHDWDERFHALVAKNLMDHPFKPMLREYTFLEYDLKAWCCNHIWLHKPPMSLWLIAGSLKLFGISALAVRIPSIVLSALSVFVLFRIGSIVSSARVGLFSAIIGAISYYHVELSIGALRIDHVDTALTFFVAVGLWAGLELLQNFKLKWIILIGISCGFAILCKWLVGLVPIGIFIATIISIKALRFKPKLWRAGLIATTIALMISAPWYIYTFLKFPDEARYEWGYNFLHLTDPVEQGAAGVFYYLQEFHWQYGLTAIPLVALGLWAICRNRKQNIYRNYLLITLGSIYAFFSIFAQTKMPSYVMIASPVVFLLMGLGLDKLARLLSHQRALRVIVMVLIFIPIMAPYNLYRVHIRNDDTRLIDATKYIAKKNNTEIYKSLSERLPEGTIVLNTPGFEDVECMFWSPFTAYHWWPTEAEFDKLIKSEHPVAAFGNHNDQTLPEYIRENDGITIIKANLMATKK